MQKHYSAQVALRHILFTSLLLSVAIVTPTTGHAFSICSWNISGKKAPVITEKQSLEIVEYHDGKVLAQNAFQEGKKLQEISLTPAQKSGAMVSLLEGFLGRSISAPESENEFIQNLIKTS